MAKDLNLAAILKRRPLRAWDAAQLMMRHLIEERQPPYQGFLKADEAQAIKDNLGPAEVPIYNRFMRLFEELEHNLLRSLTAISAFQWGTLSLERILDQFRLSAEITEEIGPALDDLGERGDEIKASLAFRLFWLAPLAQAWPAGGPYKDKADFKDKDGLGLTKGGYARFFELARNADITFLAERFRRDNPIRVACWQNVLAYEAIFKLAEAVLGIDHWAKGFALTKTVALGDKERFEAKAIYLDCLLRQAVRRNTDPTANPAARRLNEATFKALSEEDRAALTKFYPDLETETYEIDEDIALGELLDESGTPKDIDRLAEILARRIEERRQARADAEESWRANIMSTGEGGILREFVANSQKRAAEVPEYLGWYATIDLDEIARWPEGATIKDKLVAWLNADEGANRIQPLSLQDPELVGRWRAKREELRPTISAEVLGPKAYDGFLRECILTEVPAIPTGGLDPQAYAEFMAHLESFRQYAPTS